MDIVQDIYGNNYSVDTADECPESIYKKICAEFLNGWNEECKNIEGATPIEAEDEELHNMAKELRSHNYTYGYYNSLRTEYLSKIEKQNPRENLEMLSSRMSYNYSLNDAREYGREMCKTVYNQCKYASVEKIGIQYGYCYPDLYDDYFRILIYGVYDPFKK